MANSSDRCKKVQESIKRHGQTRGFFWLSLSSSNLFASGCNSDVGRGRCTREAKGFGDERQQRRRSKSGGKQQKRVRRIETREGVVTLVPMKICRGHRNMVCSSATKARQAQAKR